MIIKICNKIIQYSFYLLFILIPFIFTPLNFELFEFNKMWATYILTIVIMTAWLLKMIRQHELKIQRTPLDIPILLFLLTNVLSTIFSIDVHTSIWGYYSRFNGGLLSIFSYILLYYAFVSNFTKNTKEVYKLLLISLITGSFVALYGIFEHFGIDAQYWVQDVRNRVFSTLGQPNWLAAYLSILIPIATAFGVNVTRKLSAISYLLLAILFYLTLLFTKSRSGFLGFGIGFLFFLIMYFWSNRQSFRDTTLKIFTRTHWYLLVLIGSIGVVTFLVGLPFEQFNKFTAEKILQQMQQITTNKQQLIEPQGPALETGGTESGEIRKIVWQGAIDIGRTYPLFGSGVETFAYSYYKFKPIAHNFTSEWDFLYNKAHNEYLNYLATTGFVGLGTYLLMIGFFLKYVLLRTKNNNLAIALIAAYISILVSNFFGFSVVIINLYFFLIPGLVFVLTDRLKTQNMFTFSLPKTINENRQFQWGVVAVLLIASGYLLVTLSKFWLADVNYAKGSSLGRAGEFDKSYQYLVQAVNLRGDEPVFRDELAVHSGVLATVFYTQERATESSQLINQAISLSKEVTQSHPNNVSFWKNQARLFYTLSGIDEKYLDQAIAALTKAHLLAPTDPKISYNLGLLYGQANQPDLAIKNLEETVKLKPNYRDAYYALGLFYDEKGERQKAIAQMDYILKNIATTDAQATQLLLEWRGY